MSDAKKSVLLLGFTGRVGKKVGDELIAAGYDVYVRPQVKPYIFRRIA